MYRRVEVNLHYMVWYKINIADRLCVLTHLAVSAWILRTPSVSSGVAHLAISHRWSLAMRGFRLSQVPCGDPTMQSCDPSM
jgi:hypothetical protein